MLVFRVCIRMLHKVWSWWWQAQKPDSLAQQEIVLLPYKTGQDGNDDENHTPVAGQETDPLQGQLPAHAHVLHTNDDQVHGLVLSADTIAQLRSSEWPGPILIRWDVAKKCVQRTSFLYLCWRTATETMGITLVTVAGSILLCYMGIPIHSSLLPTATWFLRFTCQDWGTRILCALGTWYTGWALSPLFLGLAGGHALIRFLL